jgi:hypothetical protein
MKKILNTLKFQDYFYEQFSHEFRGEKRAHSYLGITFSLVINIFCMFLLILNLYQLFGRKDPTTSYTKLDLDLGYNLTLNSKDLLFSLQLRDKNHIPLKQYGNVLTIKPIYEVMIKLSNGTLINTQNELDIISCKQLKSQYEKLNLLDDYETLQIEDHYCFKLNYNKISNEIKNLCLNDVILGGQYGSDFYGNLALYINHCNNESLNNNEKCLTNETILNLIEGAWLQFYYTTASVNENNYNNPIKRCLGSYYTKLNVGLNKNIYTYFIPLSFVSKNNYVFNFEKSITFIKNDKTIADYNIIEDNQNEITYALIYVCSGMNIEYYKRKYLKIQEIEATVSGFFIVLCVFANVLLYFPHLRYLDIEIINLLFDYKPLYITQVENNSKKKHHSSNKLIINDKNNSNSKSHLVITNKGITRIKTNPHLNNNTNNNIKNNTNSISIKYKNLKNKINNNQNSNFYTHIDISKITNRLSKKQKFRNKENKINVTDIIIVYLCYCNNKFKNSKKEMNYLMKNKLKYTDITENLKLFLEFEKIKDIFYKKEILHPLDFKNIKKNLTYNLKDLQKSLNIIKNSQVKFNLFDDEIFEKNKIKKKEKSHVGTKINIQSILNSNIIEKKLSNKSLNFSIENEIDNEKENILLKKEK